MKREMGRVGATIQARMSSTRLPGKVMLPSGHDGMLGHMIKRVQRSRVDTVLVCTTDKPADDIIAYFCEIRGVDCWRGSEDDVLDRVLKGAIAHGVDTIVELTGDCPLIDHRIIDDVLAEYETSACDYASNILTRTFPRGMDTQVFSTETLRRVAGLTTDPIDREHVSLFIYQHPELFSLKSVCQAQDDSDLRLTLDTFEDLRLICTVFRDFDPSNEGRPLADMVEWLRERPDLVALNSHIRQKAVA